jgi:hypothetical protein
MKKKLGGKLRLSKETLSALTVHDFEGIRGGIPTLASMSCATDLSCGSCVRWCTASVNTGCDCY